MDDGIYIGGWWVHRRNGHKVCIVQIYRKDRMVMCDPGYVMIPIAQLREAYMPEAIYIP